MGVVGRLLLQQRLGHNEKADISNAFSRQRVDPLILVKNEPARPAIQFTEASITSEGISSIRDALEDELRYSSDDVEDVITLLPKP